MREPKIYIKIVINLIFVILAFLILFFIVPRLIRFFMPFVIGWFVAMIANPLVKALEKNVKIVRKHGSAIIIIAVIGAIIGALYFIILIITKEFMELMNDFPMIIESLDLQLSNLSNRLRMISRSLPNQAHGFIDDFILNTGLYLTEIVSGVNLPSIGTVTAFAKNIADSFLKIIIIILSAYFFTVSKDEIEQAVKKAMPVSVSDGYRIIYENFKSAVGGYFKAQFKIMLVLSLIMFVGFEIIRVNYSFLLALGIGFLDFLPVFGTGVILWPWALIDMLTGNYIRAIGLVVIYLLCQIIKQVLQPKMVGDSIGISPLATLVFMYTGYQLYGVVGIIIGIPVGMVIVNLYRVGMFNRMIKGFKIIIHDINEFRKF